MKEKKSSYLRYILVKLLVKCCKLIATTTDN